MPGQWLQAHVVTPLLFHSLPVLLPLPPEGATDVWCSWKLVVIYRKIDWV